MDNDKVGIWTFVLALIIFLVVRPVHADGVVNGTSVYTYSVWAGNINGSTILATRTDVSPTSACQDAGVVIGLTYSLWDDYIFGSLGGTCRYVGGGWRTFTATTSPVLSCPVNSSVSNSTCVCNSGYKPDAGATACVLAVVCPAAGTLYANGYFNVGTVPTGQLLKTACVSSCKIELVSGYSPAATSIISGTKYYFGQAKYNHTGQNCSPDTPNFLTDFVGNLPSNTCASGQQMISMNGVTKCFNSSGQEVSTNSASAVSAAQSMAASSAASAVQSASTYATSAGLSASGVEQAMAVASALYASGGSGGNSSSSDPVMQPFCQENPTAEVCAGQEFGVAPSTETLPSTSPSFTVSNVSFASSASCPAPVSFTISNLPMISKTYSISWQPFCDIAQIIRPIFLAIAAITAAFIFAGVTI